MKVLVTGASGFVGRNLCVCLERVQDLQLYRYDVGSAPADLDAGLANAEVIFHLAGVNRPKTVDEFHTGNAGFTDDLCHRLLASGRRPKIVLASSVQAESDNPYGISKRAAEASLRDYAQRSGAAAVVHRLKNLFGKWCRPNYNSVTATFCHNIAHGLPIQISDPANVVDLTYVDDVIAAFLAELADIRLGFRMAEPLPSHAISLGDLAALISSFRDSRKTLLLPDFSQPFVRALHATYLSYLADDAFAYPLTIKTDDRGSLAEWIKQPGLGQIFISHTKPGITRGNHYHHTKVEKFLVVQGEAIIRFRQIQGDDVIAYPVKGEEYKVVDIPPGYTHAIENVGASDLVTLFWSSEIFDQQRPDTQFNPVVKHPSEAGKAESKPT
jgi:UDP-2-acetamido-2,6-beta-L-arabino-hexul-4-ose reductase